MAYRYHRMTPARRAALRKAQLASAKKRKRNRRIATGAGIVAVTVAGAGGYKRGQKKAKAREARVPSVTLNGSKFTWTQPIKYSGGREVDLIRHSRDSQLFDENSRIDYGKIGQPIRVKQIHLTFRQARAQKKLTKAAKGIARRRKIYVNPDGTVEPIGARERAKIKARMEYKPSKRSKRYVDARDRPNPPKWLRKKD